MKLNFQFFLTFQPTVDTDSASPTAAPSVQTLVVNRQQNTYINAVATLQSSLMTTLKSDLHNSVIIPESDVPFQCKICSISSLDKKSFLGHLTGMHFCVQVCTRQKLLLYVHPRRYARP